MNLRPITFRGLQELHYTIYGAYNDKYFNDQDLMFRLYNETIECFESLRQERIHEVITRLPKIFFWTSAIANRRHIDMADAVWHKYPNVCPYGLETRACVCITREKKYNPTLSELLRFRNDTRERPVTLSQIQRMFSRIYGPINSVMTVRAVFDHLTEEVGEVGRDLWSNNIEGLPAEIADVVARLCAFATKTDNDLEELIWQTYPGVCCRCLNGTCACPPPPTGAFTKSQCA